MTKIIKLWLVVMLLTSNVVYATLDLELTQGIDTAIPIAVLPFTGPDGGNLAAIVSQDLKNSGRFRLADAVINGEINYDYWQAQRTEAVVKGNIVASGGNYKVNVKLYDIYNRNVLTSQEYTTKASALRDLAHHISDLVYEKLTGDRGVFATKIAYVLVLRNPGEPTKYKLEVADADGHNPRTLLVSTQPLMSPAWSTDGKHIAYVSFEGHRAAIYAQNVITGARRLITKYPGINGAPAWSPDGTKLALVLTQTGYPKIYILDIASNKLTRITDDWYLDTEPSWSPDGQSVLFTSNRGGGPQIYKIDVATRKITRITFQGKYNARASFTSDGNNIVMLHQDAGMFNIAIQELASGRVYVLTRSGCDESPSMAPNGKMVVYATNYKNRGILAEVSTDGRVKLLLPALEGEVQEPAWQPFVR